MDRPIADLVADLRGCLCLHLRMAAREVTSAYDEAVRPLGLKVTQFSVLAGVAALGPVSFQRLAQALALDKTTLPRNLAPLRRKGLVRVDKGEDRRSRLVRVTPQGEALLRRGYRHWSAAQQRFSRRLRGLEKPLGQLARIRAAARA